MLIDTDISINKLYQYFFTVLSDDIIVYLMNY